jgi:hypothetical protein
MIFGRFDERTHVVHEPRPGQPPPSREHAPTGTATS